MKLKLDLSIDVFTFVTYPLSCKSKNAWYASSPSNLPISESLIEKFVLDIFFNIILSIFRSMLIPPFLKILYHRKG
jgi:hypothetical protein